MSIYTIYPAHIVKSGDTYKNQTLSEHVRKTAEYASNKLKNIGLFNTAYLAGLLHDMGKATEQFKAYLEKSVYGENVVHKKVNHTFCGVIYLLERYLSGRESGIETLTCEIIAYACGAHHGQFDCIYDENNGFRHRLDKDRGDLCYNEAVKNFLNQCAGEKELDSLFEKACGEIGELYKRIGEYSTHTQLNFCIGFCARMVLSAVIEGDRRDTAEVENGLANPYISADKKLWERELSALEAKLDSFQDRDKPINLARRAFSDQCMKFAKNGDGIYRVNIPTGGGKTLSTLRYSLAHAKEYDKKRIIFVIPLLTVIEQNAKVITDVITDKDIITEHHSNVIKTHGSYDELDKYELLTQTWETPIVITTLVQLLQTLFGGTTSEVRRMSSLCDSVIVIDEVQSLPKKVIDMFNSAMNFLAYSCRSTIVLSSATHPRFDIVRRSLVYSENIDIIPYDEKLFNVFKRTAIIDKTYDAGWSIDKLAEFAEEKIAASSSLLIVCNTKKSAKQLFKNLKHLKSESCEVCHLSTAMCMKHREDTIKKISNALERRETGMKVICVSTQLIEAGVDISFGCAIRVIAGMDSVVQVAGRCNRNGEFNRLCEVYIVRLSSDNTELAKLPDIADAASVTQTLLDEIKDDPEKYNGDPAGNECINQYYDYLYRQESVKKQFPYPCKIEEKNEKLYDLLSDNRKYTKTNVKEFHLNQAFKTAGDKFTVFDEETYDVIVPYNEIAKETIEGLSSERAKYDLKYLRELSEKAKPYTVSVFKWQYNKLMENGLLYTDDEKHYTFLRLESAYDMETGIDDNPDLMA